MRVEPLERLYDAGPDDAELPLPEELERLYGGRFSLGPNALYANFVSTVDGVVALGDPSVSSGPAISGRSEADRFVMGLLRAAAGAVLIGGGTMRDDPGHLWTPEYIFPPAARAYAELRKNLGLPLRPLLAVVTAEGRLDVRERALQQDALVLTTEVGARALDAKLPKGSRLKVLAPERFTVADAVSALREDGHTRVLSEGGPRVLAELLKAQLLDELFLTLSPVLAGRSAEIRRFGLLENLAFEATSLRGMRLVSARRHGGHLLLRYSLRPTG
jgi:riboflavin biosynthesis pyrimidine reductase